jgi:hypothetical protein
MIQAHILVHIRSRWKQEEHGKKKVVYSDEKRRVSEIWGIFDGIEKSNPAAEKWIAAQTC